MKKEWWYWAKIYFLYIGLETKKECPIAREKERNNKLSNQERKKKKEKTYEITTAILAR